MPAPYSNDLRWKVVNAYQNGEGVSQEIAQCFSVSLSVVKRLWKRYQTHHDVEPARFGGWKRGSRLMSRAKLTCGNGLSKRGI